MGRHELKAAVEELAERYHLHFAKKTRAYVGLHAGLLLVVREWGGILALQVSGPVDLSPPPPPPPQRVYEPGALPVTDWEPPEPTEAPEDCPADWFPHCDSGGLPLEWLAVTPNEGGVGCDCMVKIDAGRLDALGIETLLETPDLIAKDFHAHGAPQAVACNRCDSQAVTAILMNYTLVPLCEPCSADVLDSARSGRIVQGGEVRWGALCLVLALATIVGGWLWGGVQQKPPVPSIFLLLPVVWAFGVCAAIERVTPVNLAARFLTGASILISILIGNIWGFRTNLMHNLAEQGQAFDPPGWVDTAQLYVVAFPFIWRDEVPFFFGGILGLWLSWAMLKRMGSVGVQ